MKLKNINGTSANKCHCGTWLAHWTKFAGKAPYWCSVSTCTQKAEVGAHVQKDSGTDSSWFIVPVCTMHNVAATSLDVSDYTALVSANVAQTCGKAS